MAAIIRSLSPIIFWRSLRPQPQRRCRFPRDLGLAILASAVFLRYGIRSCVGAAQFHAFLIPRYRVCVAIGLTSC
jgi:hypothetical protein